MPAIIRGQTYYHCSFCFSSKVFKWFDAMYMFSWLFHPMTGETSGNLSCCQRSLPGLCGEYEQLPGVLRPMAVSRHFGTGVHLGIDRKQQKKSFAANERRLMEIDGDWWRLWDSSLCWLSLEVLTSKNVSSQHDSTLESSLGVGCCLVSQCQDWTTHNYFILVWMPSFEKLFLQRGFQVEMMKLIVWRPSYSS